VVYKDLFRPPETCLLTVALQNIRWRIVRILVEAAWALLMMMVGFDSLCL
jgi:hypothetical protein